MPSIIHADTIYQLAEEHNGYFTTAEAVAAGVSGEALVRMVERGVLERVSQGVYRLLRYPLSKHSQYIEAVLWPQGVRGVLSHESALALHGLSDVSPSKVHITVPQKHRVRRVPPPYLVVHRALLNSYEIELIEQIPVTVPSRTIRDCHSAALSPALIRQAIEEGRTTGKLTRSEADVLLTELLQRS